MKQLRRLFDGFQYPGEFITETRHHLTGEEVFLFGIYRLSRSENFHNLISMGLMFATKILVVRPLRAQSLTDAATVR
jgi:hypothetical protein